MSGRPTAAAAVILLAMVAGGCGQQSSERPAVAHYVKQVNMIEAALARPLASVASAGNAFSRQQRFAGAVLTHRVATRSILELGPSPEQTLQKAWKQIRALRMRLAAITAPPVAGHLRVLLLELIDGQAAMTRELAELVAFLPRYTATLNALGPATRQLEAVLSQRTAYGAAAVSAAFARKATALRRFQATMDTLLAQLHRLHPPAVSRPGYAAQLTALRGMGESAGRLAAVLATGAPSNVGPVLAQFDRAAAASNGVAVQKAEIAAARAYDSRVAALNTLSQRVSVERMRLSNTLR